VEGPYSASPDGEWFGYTPNYLPVSVRTGGAEDPVNQILQVQLEGVRKDGKSLHGIASSDWR
jgi:hypothetical protein